MKRYVVGDIHGYDVPLIECLKAVNFDYENDLLIQMGDVCDRGRFTWDVVEELLKIKNLVAIKGNHDDWFLEFLLHQGQNPSWMYQGGAQTLDSYDANNWENKETHVEFFKNQMPYYVVDNLCFVHGGFDRMYPIADQDPISLCWDREFVEQMMSCSGDQRLKTADDFDHVFIGHTPTLYWTEDLPNLGVSRIYRPITKGGVTNLDTGCGKGGPLTIYDLDTKEYYQSVHKY